MYRRAGVTADNFVGTHWAGVAKPSNTGSDHLTWLSATACDAAFSLDTSGRALRLEREEVSLSVPRLRAAREDADAAMAVPKIADENVDGGWAVVV